MSDDFLNETLNIIPVVALVGRPNVGKSALFNRLTRTRDALVADFPGLTRDRKCGCMEIEDREFICIDTGGVDGIENGVGTRMAEQSLLAIGEADVVLFMVDARAGLIPADEAIAKHLRSRQRPTFLVANKTDGFDPDQAVVDSCSLGLGEICPIAVSHGRGVLNLLEHALLPWTNDVTPQEEVDKGAEYWTQLEVKENGEEEPKDDFNPQDLSIKLAIVGRPSIGEFTLTNRILGEDRVVVYDMPETMHDSIYIPMQRDEREYVLIDTVGVRKRDKITEAIEKFSVIKILQAVEGANVVMLVIDARERISDQDLSLLGFILNSGRSLVIVANRWDDLTQEVKEQVKGTLDFHLGFIDFARVHFISTLHGNGVGNLFESVHEVYDSSTHRVSTMILARIMTMAIRDHQPPLIRGHRVKLKYAHAGGYNPSIIVIHGNQVEDLPDSHKRYLMNYFRKSLDMMRMPIRIQFEEGESPFTSKRNTLTPTRMYRHECLIRHIKKNK